jgi:hypothetical protein
MLSGDLSYCVSHSRDLQLDDRLCNRP